MTTFLAMLMVSFESLEIAELVLFACDPVDRANRVPSVSVRACCFIVGMLWDKIEVGRRLDEVKKKQ